VYTGPGATGEICPVGFYCPAGVQTKLPCANGTYSPLQVSARAGVRARGARRALGRASCARDSAPCTSSDHRECPPPRPRSIRYPRALARACPAPRAPTAREGERERAARGAVAVLRRRSRAPTPPSKSDNVSFKGLCASPLSGARSPAACPPQRGLLEDCRRRADTDDGVAGAAAAVAAAPAPLTTRPAGVAAALPPPPLPPLAYSSSIS
jgi:hypothetical protein